MNETVELCVSVDSADNTEIGDTDDDFLPFRGNRSEEPSTSTPKHRKRSLINDVNDYSINRSSIRRERHKLCQDISQQLKSKFNPNTPLTVHWDGKPLKDLTGKELVDRVPVIVSGLEIYKLLGVPKLISVTGEAQGTAVTQLLENWGVQHLIRALCFDTTTTNTGRIKGACPLLEEKYKMN